MFRDRIDAGRQLAAELTTRRLAAPLVIALPRGGVPVAAEIAQALHAPLDVLIVRKLAAPSNPEFAIGALGEDGALIVHEPACAAAGVTRAAMDALVAREQAEIDRRVRAYRAGRALTPVRGRTVVLVDDGLATGATAAAGIAVLRNLGAAHIILAVPTGSAEAVGDLRHVADEVVCLEQPEWFGSVGAQYEHFDQTSDAEVVALLAEHGPPGCAAIDEQVRIPIGSGHALPGRLVVPAGARGLVVFAHGSGSSRLSPRNQAVAESLNDAGFGTLLLDLLTDGESRDRRNVFDIDELGSRLAAVRRWLTTRSDVGRLAVGYFGASTGAAAALVAAAGDPTIGAVVSRGGRPDLASDALHLVTAPTLLIVGGLDDLVLDLNRKAMGRMRCDTALEIVPGATHLFEEPGTLEQVSALARGWFAQHLR